MAKMAQSERMQLEGRASYAFLFAPRKNDAGEDQYSMTLLIPKTDERVAQWKAAAKAVGVAQFGANFVELVKAGRIRFPFRDGDVEKPDDPNYKGHFFLSMRNTNKPTVVDHNVEVLTNTDGFGSGDYCLVSGRFFAYDSKGNKGVSFSLGNVQRTRKGERLDNTVDARTEFAPRPDAGGGVAAGGGFDGDDI